MKFPASRSASWAGHAWLRNIEHLAVQEARTLGVRRGANASPQPLRGCYARSKLDLLLRAVN